MLKGNALLILGMMFILLTFTAGAYGEEACCDKPGDADGNGAGPSILDVTHIINYLYNDGPAPVCMAEGDPNGDGAINILDVGYIINYLYKGGPAPICGPDPWPGKIRDDDFLGRMTI